MSTPDPLHRACRDADLRAIMAAVQRVVLPGGSIGVIATTRSATQGCVPHMGDRDGVHYALGCNGSGVVMMSHLGHRTALKILGRTNRPSAFEGLPFETRPLYHGNPWFPPAVGTWYRFRDWLDRRMAA